MRKLIFRSLTPGRIVQQRGVFCRVLSRIGAALIAAVTAPAAQAQPAGYPVKPVRVVIPFSPGTPIEVPARAVTQRMTDALGQSFVFDYRTGASGTIGTEMVARSPKDGYTMLITNCSHSANPAYYKKLPYDTLNDFAPISQINVTYGNVLVVHPSVPARSVKELIALAKARPGVINYASAGVGSPPHVSAALFAAMADIELVHVPYKGTAVALNDLLGGHIEAMAISGTTALPYINAGRLRALAIGGPRRLPALPEMPTLQEAGLTGFDMTCYHGMFFPAGTPAEITRRVYGEVAKAVALPEVRKYLADNALIPLGSSPQEFTEFIKTDVVRQAGILKRIGVEPQ